MGPARTGLCEDNHCQWHTISAADCQSQNYYGHTPLLCAGLSEEGGASQAWLLCIKTTLETT